VPLGTDHCSSEQRGEQTEVDGIILLKHVSEVRNLTDFMWLRIWSLGH
jgi:hypothetical protein